MPLPRRCRVPPPYAAGGVGGEGHVDPLDALSPRDLQRRFFDAVLALVDGIAARQPLVLELDDLHWADPTSVDLLIELLDRADRSRLLLCCAFRPESDVACQLLRERGQWRLGERYVEVGLRPLSEAASAELVALLLGQTPAGPDGAAAAPPSALPPALRILLERAAGTPLWLEELVRALVERGILVDGDGGWQLTGDLDAVELPSSLQALIVARIDRLGPARPTLQVASVIGRRFGRNVLERVAEASSRLDDDLTQAQRADLVREIPAHAEREYDFKHVLVRDAAYATLLHRRRRALHRRVAETVERLYPERVPELHAVLAYHYERAEEWRRASEHAQAAAEAARDSFANREAIESYTQALQAAERANLEPRERGTFSRARGVVHERLGDFEAARSDYETALALAERPAAARRTTTAQIRLLGALGMLWGGHKDYARGAELTRQAVDLAVSSGDDRAQADASVQLGILLLNLLRIEEGRHSLERALACYQELGDAHGQARTLDALGLLRLLRRPPGGRRDATSRTPTSASTRSETVAVPSPAAPCSASRFSRAADAWRASGGCAASSGSPSEFGAPVSRVVRLDDSGRRSGPVRRVHARRGRGPARPRHRPRDRPPRVDAGRATDRSGGSGGRAVTWPERSSSPGDARHRP